MVPIQPAESRESRLGSQGCKPKKAKPAAAVALYFGGRPVIGSRGILADFGARAVESFQNLVSTRFAALEGPLGERGPIPQRERSALMITEVAHGSFGFVLEESEAPSAPELPVASLNEVVDEVCGLIPRLSASAPSRERRRLTLRVVPEALDKRVLGCLQSFFRILNDSGATLRIVEDRREFSLRSDMIARAKERTDAMNVEESSEVIEGRLFLLPDARRFELHPLGGGQSLKGGRSPLRRWVPSPNLRAISCQGLSGASPLSELRVRELRFKQQPGRRSYQLVAIEPAAARQSG